MHTDRGNGDSGREDAQLFHEFQFALDLRSTVSIVTKTIDENLQKKINHNPSPLLSKPECDRDILFVLHILVVDFSDVLFVR